MSIALMSAAWKTELPQTPKMVLLALCDNANDEGECYPSVQTLAKKCSVSDRAVQMQLTRLEELGYVTRDIRAGRSTVYNIRKPSDWPQTPERRSPPNDVHPTPERRSPHPRTSFTHNHQLTIIEPSENLNAKSPRGSRLPIDWSPSESQIAFLKAERPSLDLASVADRFRDYWVSVPGAKGRKVDWEATWRNWVRSTETRHATGASNPAKQSAAERNAATVAVLTGRDRRGQGEIIGGVAERLD